MEQARDALEEILPQLPDYARDEQLYIACGILTEKLRETDGMVEFWADILRLFPQNGTAFRLLMRWYRRTKQLDEGLHRAHQFALNHLQDPVQAAHLGLGFLELRAWAELDELMQVAPVSNTLRGYYIQALMEQGRISEAYDIAQALDDKDAIPPQLANRIKQLRADVTQMKVHKVADILDVLGTMVRLYADDPPKRRIAPGQVGVVAFYSGQLGIGGAERQSTRLVSTLQSHYDSQIPLGGRSIDQPPQMSVRHVTASSRSDFYLPVLQEAGVDTTILAHMEDPGMESLEPIPDMIRDLYHLLPEDIQINTRKLVQFYREKHVDVAYLWHDGGVLTAGLAAVIARVPRIVTSFRGMPPNLRRERLRGQMPALFSALADLPWATLTTNSPLTAKAYENWLNLPAGSVPAIPNAVRPLTDEGASEDITIWENIVAKSPDCTKTVLGVFRFDHNKRPEFWVETAAAYAKVHPQARFVITGRGHELDACRDLVRTLGAEHRVFLPGPTQHVGFYMYRADLLMHLARFEGLPNSLLEAAYCGCPILTTPAGGAVDIVEHGTTGHILPSAETVTQTDVHAALTSLLADPARLRQMGNAGQKHVQRSFDLSLVFEKTFSIFDQ
ncbi:glycosyltransferase [Yoonia sp. R2-816]|uniref:glycosyltransferase n=1 Tax=Yoonia sp. R2-816 TaxID=3342638 RepID=UPI00372B0AF2